MADIRKKYREVIQNLEKNISNPEELKYAQEQVKKLAMVFLDEIDRIQEEADNRFKKIEEKQQLMEDKMLYLENSLNGIEKDIYEDDDNYDLEVVCPYCNYEFVLDEDTDKNEIECPECGNIIEIDWDGECFDENCGGCHCSECDIQHLNKEDKDTKNQEDNEDDM